MSMNINVRIANEGDAAALVEIYAPYILKTAITFEYDVPTEAEFAERIRKTLSRYPYLVAEKDGRIVGYAYAGSFITRRACDWAVEASVYVKTDERKSGVGRLLYTELEKILEKQNIKNINVSIAYPVVEDEYLTKNSADFHAHMGYSLVGRFHRCGYKFGRWYDLIWMEKHLGGADYSASPEPFVPFSEL